MKQTRETSSEQSCKPKLALEPESPMHKLLTISIRGVFEDLNHATENQQAGKPKAKLIGKMRHMN